MKDKMSIIVVAPFKLMFKELKMEERLNLSPARYIFKKLKMEERVIEENTGTHFHGIKRSTRNQNSYNIPNPQLQERSNLVPVKVIEDIALSLDDV